MKDVRHAGLTKYDMRMVVDLVGLDLIKDIIKGSVYEKKYLGSLDRENAIYFLQEELSKIIGRNATRKFYRDLNKRIININLKLKEANINYEEILKGKKLRELRGLFEKAKLDYYEMRAIPILLKCLDIEYTNSISFTIENELYIRSRIKNEIDREEYKYTQYMNEINKLTLELDDSKLNIKKKDKRIAELEQITRNLELELTQYDPEIGYYSELTQIDYVKIIEDLGKYSSEIKDKFKQLIQKFEESENKPEYKLYEIWMEWTDDEVTILDSVLKKSMYEEVIKRSDINDLEYISENIMNRYLLSRLLLHLIYRRMSSQYLEEVLG